MLIRKCWCTNVCIGAARPYGSLQSSPLDWAIRLANQREANLRAVEAVHSYSAQHSRREERAMILGRTLAPFWRVHPAWLVLSSVSA